MASLRSQRATTDLNLNGQNENAMQQTRQLRVKGALQGGGNSLKPTGIEENKTMLTRLVGRRTALGEIGNNPDQGALGKLRNNKSKHINYKLTDLKYLNRYQNNFLVIF